MCMIKVLGFLATIEFQGAIKTKKALSFSWLRNQYLNNQKNAIRYTQVSKRLSFALFVYKFPRGNPHTKA